VGRPRKRDKRNGQFAHADPSLVCVCGHGLGVHAAEIVAGERPCFNADWGDAAVCDCVRFRRSRVAAVEVAPDAMAGKCARCGRPFISDQCMVHVPPVACGSAARVAKVLDRCSRVPALCPACGHVVCGEALPGAETLCSVCGVSLVFSPVGWARV